MSSLEHITPILEAKLAAMGYDLFDLKYVNAGPRSVLRVCIDKPGGISVTDCENVSSTLSTILDLENFSVQHYTLEVSSPGLDRPLIRAKDFARVIGQTIKLVLKSEAEHPVKTLVGLLKAVENESVILEIDTQATTFLLTDVAHGKVEITFS